jgi:hypothetical protein
MGPTNITEMGEALSPPKLIEEWPTRVKGSRPRDGGVSGIVAIFVPTYISDVSNFHLSLFSKLVADVCVGEAYDQPASLIPQADVEVEPAGSMVVKVLPE